VVQVDIISDVMCPWCIVAFKQLEMALAHTGIGARVRWHPFELNPDMPPEGENLSEHIQRKYGTTRADSETARQQLKDVGAALGFAFRLDAGSRIVNSFAAHCLLDFAATQGKQHPLKIALFEAHFSEGLDVSDPEVLVRLASGIGLEGDAARAALGDARHATAVRAQERVWAENGITSVPTMIFNESYVVNGAQGPKTYADLLARIRAEAA
jgi:predicted DsbA family dithiol-disulfide isomerase